MITSKNILGSRIQSQLQQQHRNPDPAERCQKTPDLHWQNQTSHPGAAELSSLPNPKSLPSQIMLLPWLLSNTNLWLWKEMSQLGLVKPSP